MQEVPEDRLRLTYEQALDFVGSLHGRGWRLGLDRIEEFVLRCGLRGALGGADGPQFIHVAGTNGKGSVTAYIMHALHAMGFRAGGFFSPYVVDPRERVQVNGKMISPDLYAEIVSDLVPIANSMTGSDFGGVTEFEVKTAIGLEAWKRTGMEWVALEVGLGGRLDATNVVLPKACAIVSIGWDHMHILGDTLEKIATEKAGILKLGIPVVVGQMEPGPRQTILSRASELGCPAWTVGSEVEFVSLSSETVRVCTPHSEVVLRPGLFGAIQHHNAAVAYAALELALSKKELGARQSGLLAGFRDTRIPARFQTFEWMGIEVVVDGAHNLDAGRVLRETFVHRHGQNRGHLISGMVQGHEPSTFYQQIAAIVGSASAVGIDSTRSLTAEAVGGAMQQAGIDAKLYTCFGKAISAAQRRGERLIIVTGSLYLAGEAIRWLESNGAREVQLAGQDES